MDVPYILLVGVPLLLLVLLRLHRDRRIVARFLTDVKSGGELDLSPLDRVVRSERARALESAIRWLHLEDENRKAQVCLEKLRELKPDLAATLAANAPSGPSDADDASHRMAREGLERNPRDTELRLAVADQLFHAGHAAEALDVLQQSPVQDAGLQMLLARVLRALHREEDALVAARRAESIADALHSRNPRQAAHWYDVRQQARHLVAQLAPSDSPVEAFGNLARSGTLASSSWHNEFILGRSLRGELDPESGGHAALRDPHAVLDSVDRMSPMEQQDVDVVIASGVCELRVGEAGRAEAHFTRVRERAPSDFRVVLGVGASIRARELGLASRAARLRHRIGEPGDVAAFPDWDALSELERAVLVACAEPLMAHLPNPEEWPRIAPIATVEPTGFLCEELDTLDTHHWPSALSLAHLAYPSVTEAHGAELVDLMESLADAVHEVGFTELDDLEAFFVTAYRDWLVDRHFGLDTGPLNRQVARFFNRMAARR